MKKIALVLFLLLTFPSLVLAKECGVLEFGSDTMWEYRNGSFFDIDGKLLSSTVPSKKKIQTNALAGLVTIEKAGSVKSKGKTSALKFSIKPAAGKVIQTLKSGKKLIGFTNGSAEDLSFYLINAADGSVYKASIADSVKGKGKIVFKLDDEAFFSPDDCRDDDPEL